MFFVLDTLYGVIREYANPSFCHGWARCALEQAAQYILPCKTVFSQAFSARLSVFVFRCQQFFHNTGRDKDVRLFG